MAEPVRSRPVAKTGSRTREAGADTKARIIEAALQTLREEGIVGTSARAIARRGGFNQALIFYHFGSVEEVLLAVVDRLSAERMARYHERLEGVTSLPELVRVAGALHAADTEDGHIRVLSQLLAGSAAAGEFGVEMRKRFDPWIELVAGVIRRVIAGTPYEWVVPVDQLAISVAALFVGIELFTQMGDDGRESEALFQTMGLLAAILGNLLEQVPPVDLSDVGPAAPATATAARAAPKRPRKK